MNRKPLIVLILAIGSFIVGTIGFRYYQYTQIPEWKWQLGGPAPTLLPIYEDSEFSVQCQKSFHYIEGDLLYAKNWSETEVQGLLKFIEIPPIPDEAITTGDQFSIELLEISMLRDSATFTIAQRFGSGAPIDEEYRDILIDKLTEGLNQRDSSRYFFLSVANVMQSGLADTPGPIRDRLFLIYDYPATESFGPYAEMTVANIKRQLTARGTFEIEGDN